MTTQEGQMTYWLFIYCVDMACLCMAFYAFGYFIVALDEKKWWLQFVIDACASFCIVDIVDKYWLKRYSFTGDDALGILIAIVLFLLKQRKAAKKLKRAQWKKN